MMGGKILEKMDVEEPYLDVLEVNFLILAEVNDRAQEVEETLVALE